MWVDVECHYDRECVVQLASCRLGLVFDALALQGHAMGELLQPLLSDERVCKVFHGHFNDFNDFSWLNSHFGFVVNPPIFFTAANAQELDGMWEDGQPSPPMACRQYPDYELDKTYQTATDAGALRYVWEEQIL